MAKIDRFISETGKTVTQDVNGIVSDVKNEFSKDEIKNLVKQSITKGIANCQLDREKKTEDASRPGNAVTAITKTVNAITKSIEGTLDCTKLQQEVKKHLDSMKIQIDESTEFIQQKLEETLGLVKVPLNPFKIPKYIVKQTIGRVLPDLKATIDFIISTVALVNALIKLIDTVSKIQERLEACAFDTIKAVTSFARNEIDQAINELKMTVSDAIADAICNSLQQSGIKANDIDDVFTAINSIKQLKDSLVELQTTSIAALGSSVAQIGSKQADIQTLTGIPPVLDTASLDTFVDSVNSPEYTQYLTDVAAVVNLPEPVNTELPLITGTAAVGETLVSSNGVWTANGVVSNAFTLAFQWMKQGQEIFGANTYQYVPVIDDVDYPVYCRVRAENQINIEEVFTANTSPVVFSMSANNKPTISGTPTVGQTLTCSDGVWPFTTTAFTYEWSRVVVPGSNVRVQSSSSNNTYYVKTADIGSSIKCKVVAQAFRYTLSVDSANTAVVS